MVTEAVKLQEYRVCPAGLVRSKRGPFRCDAESGRQIVAAFERHGADLPVDFEHQTLGGQFSSPDGTAPAVGWIKALRFDPERGLMASIEWNQRGRDAIDSRSYRYLSPTLLIEKDSNRAVELHSIALTNKPAIARMDRLAASMRCIGMEIQPMADTPTEAQDDVATAEQKMGELKSLLTSKGIELGDNADFVAILNAAISLINGENEAGDGATGDTETAANASGLRAGLRHAMTRVQQLEAMTANHSVTGMIDTYLRQGKLLENHTSQMDWARRVAFSDPEGFKLIMETAPVIVPQGRTTAPSHAARGFSNDGSRRSVIMSAFSEWQRDGDDLGKMTTSTALINMRLRDAGHTAMNETEAKQYA